MASGSADLSQIVETWFKDHEGFEFISHTHSNNALIYATAARYSTGTASHDFLSSVSRALLMAPTVDDCKALHDKYQWYLAGDFFTAWSEDDLQAFIKEEVGKLNIRAPLRPMYVELLGETFRRELERLDVMYQAFKEEQMWLMVTDAAAAYVGSPEAPVISHIPEHSQLHGEEVDWVVV